VAASALDELARLRLEVDRIDDAVVDLLLERIAVVHRIGAVKTTAALATATVALRPAREAQIIRRLAAKAAPDLPAIAVARMWRELLAATTRLQTPFAAAVLADGRTPVIDGADGLPVIAVRRAAGRVRAGHRDLGARGAVKAKCGTTNHRGSTPFEGQGTGRGAGLPLPCPR